MITKTECWGQRDGSGIRDEEYDFTGMGSMRGLMVAPELSTWISEQISRDNAVAKERRKAREERALARQKPKGGKDGKEGD